MILRILKALERYYISKRGALAIFSLNSTENRGQKFQTGCERIVKRMKIICGSLCIKNTGILSFDGKVTMMGKFLPFFLIYVILNSCGYPTKQHSEDVDVSANLLFEDTTAALSFEQISAPDFAEKYSQVDHNNIVLTNPKSNYWYKFSLKTFQQSPLLYLETNLNYKNVEMYAPDKLGGYNKQTGGTDVAFDQWKINFRKIAFEVPFIDSTKFYYANIKVNSPLSLNIIPWLATEFINLNLSQYLYFGIFFGILAIAGIFTLIFYFYLKDRVFLYYSLYIISLGAFAVVFWQITNLFSILKYIPWNNLFYTLPYVSMTIFFLAYSNALLDNGKDVNKYHTVINMLITSRIILLVIGMAFDLSVLVGNYIDLAFIFICYGFCMNAFFMRKKKIGFLILGQSIFLTGIIIHTMNTNFQTKVDTSTFHFLNLGLYKVVCFAAALAVRFRETKREKDQAKENIIKHLEEIDLIKDKVNRELESEVQKRTEVIAEQARQIEAMNALLLKDNKELKGSVTDLSTARVMQKLPNFEEFKTVFPDDETCYRYLSELKWSGGYSCKNCHHIEYFSGKSIYSRRCKKCKYEESVTADTLFHKLKFSIVKAFYMLYLVTDNPSITTTNLSSTLEVGIESCWTYRKKILTVLKSIKSTKKKVLWKDLILTGKLEK